MDIRERYAHLPLEQQLAAEKYFSGGKKKKQSPANSLTDAIITYCSSLGCATARINVMGIFDQTIGKYRTSGSTKGVEDIDITMPVYVSTMKIGVKVAVEVKIGRDAQSEDQVFRQSKLTQTGAHYIIAKTFDTFKQDFDRVRELYETK